MEGRNARKRRVFDSVFGSTKISEPTPFSTPLGNFTSPGQAFGGPAVTHTSQKASQALDESDYVRDQVHWDRAWHVVTHFLSLQIIPVDSDPLQTLYLEPKSPDNTVIEALKDILQFQSRLPLASHTEDIIVWHTRQTRHHFLYQILPILGRIHDRQSSEAVLIASVEILTAAHRQYLHKLSLIAEQEESFRPGSSRKILQKFLRSLHAIISNCVAGHLAEAIRDVLLRYVFTVLGLPLKEDAKGSGISPASARTEKFCSQMLRLVESLHKVGLAGERFEVIFAEIMNDAMTKYVFWGFRGLWSADSSPPQGGSNHGDRKESYLLRMVHHASPSRCAMDLCEWIEERYSKLVVLVFGILDNVQVSWSDKEKWKEMSVGRLAVLRTHELFDIVSNWPHSDGALHDLRTAITTPQRRLHLTDLFAKVLHERLLHPGTSTLQILQIYISMIWSFHALDHSKVLLDRVAYPLQLYLCSREDTVRIIIAGLLSDIVDSHGNPIEPGSERLTELALILHRRTEQVGKKANEDGLDWHDLEWLPDPVDAGPGYRRSKSADVIGTLIGVLGSQEVFIKEFQSIIGEQLLKHDGAFEKEIKVLELLKTRFGEAPLQSCEVMLKDIQDSSRVNGVIRRNQKLGPSEEEINAIKQNPDIREGNAVGPEGHYKPSLHAKILSRLFWPQLQDEAYRIPDEIAELQKQYEVGFESLKSSRKLTWLHALGQATVELELEDRTVLEEVYTWQATVIWAFQSDDGNPACQRSVGELTEHLEMDEPLIRSALNFWVSKLVIHETEKDVFAVLETLNQEDRARSNAQAAAAAAVVADEETDDTALVANDGMTTEKMQMYWQFIQGMLTNSSSQMPLQQIAMMLKMLIADGFPYSNEELQEFLGRKVTDGDLELVGGKYKLKK